MKFPHLLVGQRFRFNDKIYTKTGPLTAREETTGKNQLIMKSADVEPLVSVEHTDQLTQNQFSTMEVRSLLIDYRARLREQLQEAAEPQGSLQLEKVLELVDGLKLPADLD